MGTVFDQSGAVIAGATVTVTDVQKGISRTLVTDSAGAYNAPDLSPDTYTVRAEAKGFKVTERQNIALGVGQEMHIDLSLQTGEQTQTVTVTEQVPLVETTNATLGGTLSNETINELPLNGRNYQNLLTLRPGVMLFPGGGAYTQSANGSRAEDIGYLIDGLRGDEAYTGQSVLNAPIAAGDDSTSLPIDAIQEFNVEENPKAEYGWKPGAIVNAGLKSGTNTIHGTALAFGRDTAMDARNFFNQVPAAKSPVELQQFGGTLGGPIKKDKMFYFLGYEGQRYSVGSTYQTTTPATVSLGGDPTNSLVDACNKVASNGSGGFNPIGAPKGVSPLSAQIAGVSINPVTGCSIAPTNFTPGTSESLFPANSGTSPLGPTTLVLGLVSQNQQDNGVAKVDFHPDEKNSLNGMYFYGTGGGIWNDAAYQSGAPWMSNLHGTAQMGSGAWTWTPNSTLVNEFRVGYDHFNQVYVSVDHTVSPLAYGINTGVTNPSYFGFPFIRFSGFNVRLGGNWPKLRGPDGSLQVLEHVSILHGNHSFKFGGEIIYNTATPFVTANGKGTVRFGSNKSKVNRGPNNTALENFLAGFPRDKGTISAILVGSPLRHYHNYQYAAFVQDDWRATPRITVNLGVRYELITVLKDANNQIGNFDPIAGLVQVGAGQADAYHGDHNNFSPRLGIAWDIRGNGRTVIRAGGSVMYEQLPFNVFDNVANQLGLSQVPTGATFIVNGVATKGRGNMGVLTVSVNGSTMNFSGSSLAGGTTTVFPSSVFQLQCGDGILVPGDPAPCNTEALDPNVRTPYLETWMVDVQRSITNNLSLTVGYVGTHGAKFLGFRDINQPVVGSCPDGSLSCIQAARPLNTAFPYLAQIDQLSNLDRSNYHGLQVSLVQRTSHGLSLIAGYTYSHALDDASSNWNANPLPPDSYNPALQYGSSDFDIRHRLTLGLTYNIPGKNSPAQLLQGWAINSRVTLQSGLPWSVQDTSNDFTGTGQVNELNSFGQPWNFFGNPSDFKSGPNPLPFIDPSSPAFPSACTSHAALTDLQTFGCYVQGNSVLVPPAAGTLGNSGRNIFRDSGFRNWDLSITKRWIFKERLTAQFRAEAFNVLNHPAFTNPGGPAGAGFNDPSSSQFGCGCNTPDQAAPNPVLGSGAARSIQLGLKLIF